MGFHGRDHDHGVVEQLLEPGAHFFRDGQRATLFDAGDDFQQQRAGDLVDGQPLQVREDIVLEGAADLIERALTALFKGELPMLQPLLIDRDEGVFACQLDGLALLLAVATGVDALGKQGTRFVPQITGFT